jgi:chromosome segregation ATPase
MKTAAYQEHFEEYSKIILADAVESIAKVWLHAWCRYRSWLRDHELACSKEKLRVAEADYKGAGKIMETYPALIEAKGVSVKEAEATLEVRQTDLDEALANNRSAKTKTDARDRASDKLKKLQRELEDLQNALDKAVSYIEIYQACYVAAQIEVATKEEEIKKYGKTSTV